MAAAQPTIRVYLRTSCTRAIATPNCCINNFPLLSKTTLIFSFPFLLRCRLLVPQ